MAIMRDRLRDKARLHTVYADLYKTEFVVRSGTSGNLYTVTKTWGGLACTCPYGLEHYTERCSHTIAVEMYVDNRNRLSVERQHRDITIHIRGDKVIVE